MGHEWCAECGAERRGGEYACSACDSPFFLGYVPGEALTQHRADLESPEAHLNGFMADKMRLPPGTVAVVAGPAGIGKTTMALQMLSTPWLCSNEMSVDQVGEYVMRLGAPLAGFNRPDWYDLPGGGMVCDFGHAEGVDLVYDSISAAPNERAVIDAAADYAQIHNVRVVVIAHYTKDGKIKGTTSVEHLFDHVVRMEYAPNGGATVRVPKTRAGAKGGPWPYELDAGGVQRPAIVGFYSIEGNAGAYRLQRHPSGGGARYADVLARAEHDDDFRGTLPRPPFAVTARSSRLYPGGWAEPEDVQARAAFAAALGVTHWSPING